MGLDETYDRILSSIDEGDREYVVRTLHWLVGADQPLSFREFAEAVALNRENDRLHPNERLIEPEDVFEICGSLIRIEEDLTVVLAHFSVKEYLLSSRLVGKEHGLAKFALEAECSRRHVTTCFISYMASIGLGAQDLQHGVLDEKEFSLMSCARSARIDRFQDYDAVRPWVVMHLSADDAQHSEWLRLVDYLEAPTRYGSNYHVAWAMRKVLQLSLMCFGTDTWLVTGPETLNRER